MANENNIMKNSINQKSLSINKASKRGFGIP
jgi:hypothetical protein